MRGGQLPGGLPVGGQPLGGGLAGALGAGAVGLPPGQAGLQPGGVGLRGGGKGGQRLLQGFGAGVQGVLPVLGGPALLGGLVQRGFQRAGLPGQVLLCGVQRRQVGVGQALSGGLGRGGLCGALGGRGGGLLPGGVPALLQPGALFGQPGALLGQLVGAGLVGGQRGDAGLQAGQAGAQAGLLGLQGALQRGVVQRRGGGAGVAGAAAGKKGVGGLLQGLPPGLGRGVAAAGGLAGFGGGFLGGGHGAGGVVHLDLGHGGVGQRGGRGVVRRAADGAGLPFGQVFGQQAGALGVQAAQQRGVAGGGVVRCGLGGAVGGLGFGGVALGPADARQVGQAGGAGVQQGLGGLGLGLQAGQLGLRRAQLGQRLLGGGQAVGGFIQRGPGLCLGFGIRLGGAAGGVGGAAGFGQRAVAGDLAFQRVQAGGQRFQLRAAGLGLGPGGLPGGQGVGLGVPVPADLGQLLAQAGPAAGGFQRGGGLGDLRVQRLHGLGGFGRGAGVGLDQRGRQRFGLGGAVGVARGLQGGQGHSLGGVGGGLQAAHVQKQRIVGAGGGLFGLAGPVAGGLGQLLVGPGAEDLPQDPGAVGGGRVQQPGEIVLRQHRHLGELLRVNAQKRRDRRRDLPHAGDRFLRLPHQLGPGGHGGIALAAGLAALLLRRAGDGVLPPGVGKGQPHVGGGGGVGKVAAQHRRLPVTAGDLAVQRKGDGVKQRSLARAGVAGDQKQPALPELAEIQRCYAGVGAKGAQLQHQRPHGATSSRKAFSASSSAWVGARPCTVAKKSPNSSAKLRRRTCAAVRAAPSGAALRGA